MRLLLHTVGFRWQVAKPNDLSPGATFLHEEINKGFDKINSRLDTQNGQIRDIQLWRASVVGALRVIGGMSVVITVAVGVISVINNS